MGDGDEVIGLSPSFFLCFECSRSWCVPSLGCLLLIRSLCPSGVVLPALLVVCRGVWRGVVCRAVVLCGGACRSSFVPRVGRRAACPAFLVSWLSAGGGSLALRGSSRLIGTGGGTVRLPSSACLDKAGGECGDYVN